MDGLTSRAIQSFVRDTYEPEAWRTTVECGNLPVAQFEAMLSYDDALTSQTL